MAVTVIIILTVLYYFFKSLEDLIDSKYTKDQNDSTLWHRHNFWQVFLFGVGLSLGFYGLSLDACFSLLFIGAMSIVLFNPLMAHGLGVKDFLYIGSGAIEKHFKNRKLMYYLVNVLLVVGSLFWLIFM